MGFSKFCDNMLTMNAIAKPLSKALFDSDLIAVRLLLAIGEMCWAIMLFWPGDSFVRPTYTLMAAVAPETVWAVLFLLTSVCQISVVLFAAMHTLAGRIFATWNAALWVFSVVAMLVSVYPPPAAIGMEIAGMAGALWVWARPLFLRRWHRLCAGGYCVHT